ncbi:MAG: hypothetical protein H7326_00370, partial [Bdellovibrionaceae bacterium]|nr:hypothetical protein [Pseudobdellovibrionaceae bacterium]
MRKVVPKWVRFGAGTLNASFKVMKKIAISALLLLSACQSFEASGPAEGQCPKAHIDNGSGICRPLNSLSQQELFVARLRLDEEAQSGAGKESDQARQETQIMINKIIESNRQRSAKEES